MAVKFRVDQHLDVTTTTAHPHLAAETGSRVRRRAVAAWLFICCSLIFAMVVVGGITRLTLSGLSITEWQPVVGVLPPLSAADWASQFAKYKEIPEYRAVHSGMSLDEFKAIYFWEYAHRLLGRLIALVYAVPLGWFWVRRWLPRRLIPALSGILLLGCAQGGLGWYMVESGLVDRPEVSQYRLVAHLALALAIYAAILWAALSVVRRPIPSPPPRARQGRVEVGWRWAADAILFFVAVTVLAGGFVAGTRAGLTYNTFPLMDGRLVPEGYDQLRPFILNWFENMAAVQFNHRLLAVTTVIVIFLVWAVGWHAALPRPVRGALRGLLAVA